MREHESIKQLGIGSKSVLHGMKYAKCILTMLGENIRQIECKDWPCIYSSEGEV